METIGVDVPVMIGGVQIHPGDFIIMDCTGAVCVPSEKLEEVYAETEKISAREAKMEALIREGHSIAEARKIK